MAANRPNVTLGTELHTTLLYFPNVTTKSHVIFNERLHRLLLKMKKLFLLAALFSTSVFFTSCDKDNDPEDGTVTLRVNFKAQGNDIGLNESFAYNGADHQVSKIKMYLSNVTLVCDCGTRRNLSDVVLVDSENEVYTFDFEVPQGNYTALEMSLGLPEDVNASDPAMFDAEHPLSAVQNMYWTWASKYRFLIYEGRVDSTQSDNFDHLLVYHTGADTLYRELESIPLNLDVSGEGQYTIDVNFDLQNVLYRASDPINVFVDDATHTMDDMELARRITDNAAASFSVE